MEALTVLLQGYHDNTLQSYTYFHPMAAYIESTKLKVAESREIFEKKKALREAEELRKKKEQEENKYAPLVELLRLLFL